MAEADHLENRTAQLAKRVELLLNRLPAREQGQEQPPEATKLRHITSFNESLAKELGSIKAECQEKLKSIDQRSQVLSREAETLRVGTEALGKTKTDNLGLNNRLQSMLSDASSERSLLAKECEDLDSRATELTQGGQALRADREQLERDRKAGEEEQERRRIAHENKVKADESRIQQQSDELGQSKIAHQNKVKAEESRIQKLCDELEQDRLAHSNAVAEDIAQSQAQSKELDGKKASLITRLEDIARQRQTLNREVQKLETEKNKMLLQSAETTRRRINLEAREKEIGKREEQLSVRHEEVTAKEQQCKDFMASHNGKVDLFERVCAEYDDKQKQVARRSKGSAGEMAKSQPWRHNSAKRNRLCRACGLSWARLKPSWPPKAQR